MAERCSPSGSRVMMRAGRWSLNASGLYKARNARFVESINAGLDPDYFLLNGNLGYRFTDRFSASVQVMNIPDEQYQNILGAPMPGRWIIGSVGVRF